MKHLRLALSFLVTLKRNRKISFWTAHLGQIQNLKYTACISPHSVRMWENTDQKNSQYEHFTRSVNIGKLSLHKSD